MRIVIVDRQGAQSIWSLMNNIAAGLVARGDEVTFCRFDDGRGDSPCPPEGVKTVDLPIPPKRHTWDLIRQHQIFMRQFSTLLRQLRPDVVHTNFCWPGIPARLAAHREKVPFIVSTQHELYGSMHPHYRLGLRLTERYADVVAYVSQTVARSFGRQAALLDNVTSGRLPRHVIIHNGIDIAAAAATRNSAGIRDPRKLVCVGRLVPVKGQALVVEALPEIARRNPDTRLVLVGEGSDESFLRKRVTELKLAERVRFSGWVTHADAMREVASAGVIVVPSTGTQEGFGLVVAEAMALETPIVASRIDVFKEVLGADEQCAWFFEKGNVKGLADAVCRVLAEPVEAAVKAVRARERVYARFSMERMVHDYLRLYDRLTSSKSGQAEKYND